MRKSIIVTLETDEDLPPEFWKAIENSFGDSFASNPVVKKILTLIGTEVRDA